MSKQKKKEEVYHKLLKEVIPKIGQDSNNIILAEVMLILKQEGIIGKELTKEDEKLIKNIKETIFLSPEITQKAIRDAKYHGKSKWN